MTIENLKTFKGNDAPNQMVITDDKRNELFYSYNTLIGVFILFGRNAGIYLDEEYINHSATTSLYRNQWLGFRSTEEFRKLLRSGEHNIKIVSSNKLSILTSF